MISIRLISSYFRNQPILEWSSLSNYIDCGFAPGIFLFSTCIVLYRNLFIGCPIEVEATALIIFCWSVWLILWICSGICPLLFTIWAWGIHFQKLGWDLYIPGIRTLKFDELRITIGFVQFNEDIDKTNWQLWKYAEEEAKPKGVDVGFRVGEEDGEYWCSQKYQKLSFHI